MRIVGPVVIGATALFATGIAVAATRHVMHVPLSDGAVATIEYEGEVAPRVTVIPIARQAAQPVAAADPFSEMDAMFAAMEQRQQAMMREIAGYSFVSTTTTSSGGCGHSVEVIQRPGAAPQRVERSFGDCSGAHAAPAPHAQAAPAPAAAAPAPAVPTI
jgi:hypothetical protein